MKEIFQINQDTYVPIQEYEDLLNEVSATYGTPLSVRAIEEGQLFTVLSEFYKDIIQNITHEIGGYKKATNPSARKYSLSEFQSEFMGVPEYLCKNDRGTFSYAADVRGRIDVESPNFINSLGAYWSDVNSNKGISTYIPHMYNIEGESDVEGNPLYVLRPTYARKEGATHRINTNEPNVQSLKKSHRRSFMVPRENYVFVQADISGQDPAIFFNKMCRDEEIIKGYYEVGEYYLPVVSRVTGVPMDQIDTDLRNSYKIGILSLMNGKTLKNLAIDMGSEEHARALLNFIESNPMYSQYETKIRRDLKTSRPIAKSFIGNLTREITEGGWRGINQMKNSPIQMTGIALFAVSIFEFYRVLIEEVSEFQNMTLRDILYFCRPIIHLHDEVVMEVREDIPGLPEKVSSILQYALSVKCDDWAPMKALPIISKKYVL